MLSLMGISYTQSKTAGKGIKDQFVSGRLSGEYFSSYEHEDCGKPSKIEVRPTIKGGKEVKHHAYRWQAYIFLLTQINENGTYIEKQGLCGGSLIDKHFILTAAHCVENKTIDNILVLLGKHYVDGETIFQSEIYVSEIR